MNNIPLEFGSATIFTIDGARSVVKTYICPLVGRRRV